MLGALGHQEWQGLLYLGLGGLRVKAVARVDDVLGRSGRVGDRGLRPALEGVEEEPDVLGGVVEGIRVGHDDKLVVGGDAELVDGDHSGVLAALLEIDALDVEESAQHRLGAVVQDRRQQPLLHVDRVDIAGGEVGAVENRLQVGLLVGDAGGGDRLATEVLDVLDARVLQPDHRRERSRDQGGDRLDRQALVLRQEDLGLIGDRQVDAAGGDLLDRGRGIGRRLRLDVEARVAEVPVVDRLEDSGVVGVDVEVERQAERLRRPGAGRLRLLPAARGDGRRADRKGHGGRSNALRTYLDHQASSFQWLLVWAGPHQATRRSSTASSPNRRIASADSTTTAAKVRAVWSCAEACWIRWPRPELDPAHSPKTAPITATATAIFAPLKKYGRAVGASTRRSVCRRLASRVRIIFSRSGSTERRPSSVLTVIGKKQISAMTASFGPIPKPSQTTRMGATTTIGTVCDATSNG